MDTAPPISTLPGLLRTLTLIRRNAQLSTGPRTGQGKIRSRGNAIKHGILASELLITEGMGCEVKAEFHELLNGLWEDLCPVGMLEELLVQKIAVCYWRQRRALQCEAQLFKRQDLNFLETWARDSTIEAYDVTMRDELMNCGKSDEERMLYRKLLKDPLRLPLGSDLDRVLRYETIISRQLAFALNQLERLQRARKGENVPAPITVQLSTSE